VSIWKIAFKNIRGNLVKSVTVLLSVLGVSGLFVSMILIMSGAQYSLQNGLHRLGADILVVPEGTEDKVEGALLMGKPTQVWMPESSMAAISAVDGVIRSSPQIYLQSLFGASCCAVSEMFLVVIDPATDFSIKPWLEKNLGRDLAKGEVIGGTYISTMGEPYLVLYGYNLSLVGTLEPTGMGIDQTLFMSMETAQEMARSSLSTAVSPLEIPAGQISSILVQVDDKVDRHKVAIAIQAAVQGVAAIESPNLFGAFRKQMLGLLSGLTILTSFAWVISAIVIGLVFNMATHERRREIAVLRGLGFNRAYIFRSIWLEAVLLTVSGAFLGVFLTSAIIRLLTNYIAGTLGMPFLFPSFLSYLVILIETLLLAVLTASAGAFIPAYRISRQEPALAMRE
jgi:putative ABC transport system permease protein